LYVPFVDAATGKRLEPFDAAWFVPFGDSWPSVSANIVSPRLRFALWWLPTGFAVEGAMTASSAPSSPPDAPRCRRPSSWAGGRTEEVWELE
jgi:hypothetical protein